MKTVTVAIIGAGQRGNDTYGEILLNDLQQVRVVAVAEPIKERRDITANRHDIDEAHTFENYEQFFAQEKMCDAVIICTSDDLHYEPAKLALQKGYHLLLEKPMINKAEDVTKLETLISEHPNQIFMVCHVLRYTPFFSKIKELLNQHTIGDLVSIQHNENIGYYHIAHSYVRGIWRNTIESSPIILAKSCHDLDILNYLVDSKCTKVASFGQLKHFRKECMPPSASEHCITCSLEGTCPYSAKQIYLSRMGGWPATVLTLDQTEAGIMKALAEGPYGRCVYMCDNDVVDHQVTILEYENGVNVTFNLCGYTHDISRTLKIMGTKGEIRAHMELNEIDVHLFGQSGIKQIKPVENVEGHVGHGGGDARLLSDFIELVSQHGTPNQRVGKTSAQTSLESHKMAFAAEESRLNHHVVML